MYRTYLQRMRQQFTLTQDRVEAIEREADALSTPDAIRMSAELRATLSVTRLRLHDMHRGCVDLDEMSRRSFAVSFDRHHESVLRTQRRPA